LGNIRHADLVFTGPLFPGGEKIKVSGTAETIYKHLRTQNPNYDHDFKDILSDKTPMADTNAKHRNIARQNRGAAGIMGLECSPAGTSPANARVIKTEGYHYLHGLAGDCNIDGGGTCGRISCSYGSAVVYCNYVSRSPMQGLRPATLDTG